MKIRNIAELLGEMGKVFEKGIGVTNGNNNTLIITGHAALNHEVDRLIQFNLLIDLTSKIANIKEIFINRSQEVSVDKNIGLQYSVLISQVAESIKSFIQIISTCLPVQEENDILVMIPPTNTLGEFVECLDQVEKSLSIPIKHIFPGQDIGVKALDNGSLWVEISIGTTAVLQLIAAISFSAAVIRKKMLEGNLLEKQIESLGIKNDALRQIQEAQKKSLALLVEAEAQNVAKLSGCNSDPEVIAKISLSIKTMAAILERGGRIYPGQLAPEEAKNLFPDMGKLNFVESRQARLPLPDE